MITDNYNFILVLRMYYTYIIFFVNVLLMNSGKTVFLKVMMLILSMNISDSLLSYCSKIVFC